MGSGRCGTCADCRTTHDGPYCFKGSRPKPVSALAERDCWTDTPSTPVPALTKVCGKCGRELPVSSFGRHSRTKDGYQPFCKECLSEQNSGKGKRKPFKHDESPAMPEEVRRIVEEHTPKKPARETKPRGRKILHPDTVVDGVKMHWCGNCKQYKPVTEFSKDSSNKSGLATQCKACRVVLEHERRVRRREEKKAAQEAVPKGQTGAEVPAPEQAGIAVQAVQEAPAKGQTGVVSIKIEAAGKGPETIFPERMVMDNPKGKLVFERETPEQAEFRRWAEKNVGPKTPLSDISIDDIVNELRRRGISGQLIIHL